VIADTATLATLPPRELRAGLAEVVKHALICDAAFFSWLEANADALLALDPVALAHAVHRCCTIKAGVVSRDERETGERALLNLGHTFGHAIETIPALDLLHGEAVAIGMVAACRTSVACGGLQPATADRVAGLLAALQLPTRLATSVPAAEIRRRMGFDKKMAAGVLRLVLPRTLGAVEVVAGVPDDAIAAGLASIGARA
jgi:3-dehydroquinate synthase